MFPEGIHKKPLELSVIIVKGIVVRIEIIERTLILRKAQQLQEGLKQYKISD